MHRVRNSPWNPILFALPNENYYLRMRERKRERYREERDQWNPVYKPMLRISPLLYVAYFSFALCCSLYLCLSFLFSLCLCCVCICSLFLYLPSFFLFPLVLFILLVEGSLFIEKFEKLLPPFFVPQMTG